MDEPPPEENERVAEIFLADTDGTLAALLTGHLEKNNHRVTVFTSDAQLDDTLLSRKPDLLIYDGSTGGPERYAVIRRIKADENQWSIPVLALTSALTIHDLLAVLESNADNFIAPPYDTPDHLSLIKGMLTTPVERPAPGEIKKQFRVRQDDQTYIIAAPARKLLEYLLSAFEMVVGTSSELSCITSKNLELSESARDLEQVITGQKKDIEALNGTARENEQKMAALSRKCEELEKTLAQKTEEIKNLAAECDARKTSLDTVQNALVEEETRSATLEKTVQDLTSELGSQKSAVADGKNRLLLAEQEITTLNEAKTRSEHDLNQVITGLNETVQHHAAELARLKSELEEETSRRVRAENLADERQREFEQSQNTVHSETEEITRQVCNLQESLAASAAALETERELRRVSEEKLKAVAEQQEALEQQTRVANEEMERANKDQATFISQIKEELLASGQQIQLLETNVSNLAREKTDAEEEVRTLTAELGHAGTAAASERKSHPGNSEGHADAGKERHLVQQSLFSPDEGTDPKEDLDLVIPVEPHLPVTVKPVPPPVASGAAPGLQGPRVPAKDRVHGEVPVGAGRVFSGIIPRVSGTSDTDSIFLEHEPVGKNTDTPQGPTNINRSAEANTVLEYSSDEPSTGDDTIKQQSSYAGVKPEPETVKNPDRPGSEAGPGGQPYKTPDQPGGTVPGGDTPFNSRQWLDLIRWAHHTDALSQDQRVRIIRMGRLIQKDRKLTKRQQEQVTEILSSAFALGYQPR